MDFVDTAIVRLARPESRAALFDERALTDILAASYDVDASAAGAPFTPIFDELRVVFDARPVIDVVGTVRLATGEHLGAQLEASGPGMSIVRIDALWSGAIVATASPGEDRVADVELDWRTVGPVEADATARLTFEPGVTPRASVRFPIAAAILVRPAGTSLATLLADTRAVRDQLDRLGLARPAGPELKPRRAAIVVWMLPAITFDDEGWPGGEDMSLTSEARRERRRVDAGRWLAREGIGLAVPPS